VEVAAAGGLDDGALDPGAVGVAVPPGRGCMLGAEQALGLILDARAEGQASGAGGRSVQRARSAQAGFRASAVVAGIAAYSGA
jgi:hypothetical protein